MSLPLLRPLRTRALGLLWGGMAASAIGDELFRVVLGWVAVRALGPAAGYLAVAQSAAMLATLLLAGRWLDGISPLRAMLGADLARAAALAALVLAWRVLGGPPGWALFLTIAVLGAGAAAFRPALQAALPPLAGDRTMLPAANALIDTTERLARLLGPGLLIIAAALLPEVHFISANAVTFVLSALAIWLIMRRHRLPGRGAANETLLQAFWRGVRVARSHRLLGFMLLVSGLQNGVWMAVYYLAVPLHLERGLDGTSGLAAFGTVIAAYGAGNLASTLVFGNLPMPARPALRVFAGIILFGAATIAMGGAMSGAMLLPAAFQLPAVAAAAALAAVGGPMQDIVVATLRQTELPPDDIAAVVRAFMVSVQGGTILAMLAAPALVQALGPAACVLGGGLIYVAIGVVGLARPHRLAN